jgi:hypothetical protein
VNILLATATVDPGETPVVTLRDPKIRLAHYAAATLLWARRGPFDAIVLCENSGKGQALAGLSGPVEAAGKQFEFLGFDGNSGSWENGKGYGEGVILAHAFSHSALLKNATSIWKTTGRLFVENAVELLSFHEKDENVLDPGDTRFFKVGAKFFRDHLLAVYRKVNDHKGVSIEVAYERTLEPFRKAGQMIGFRRPKIYVGQDAGSGNWHLPFPPEVLREAEEWRDAVPV